MAFYNAIYVTSATSMKQWPESKLPEVLLVGRSNVGKSSLINTIFNNKKLAYTGKTPGKTRMLNFFSSKQLMFVDAPGYGYANRSKKEVTDYNRLMDDYLNKRENLKLIIWILDIRRIPNEDDILMQNWLLASDHDYILVLNKIDKLSNAQKIKQTTLIKKALHIDQKPIIHYSAKSLAGKDVLLQKLTTIIQQ